MLPGWMQKELDQHRMEFAPVRKGFLSDHLPMSSMAMWNLGFDRADILSWMAAYRQLLEPASPSPPVDNLESALGDDSRYRSLIEYFDKEQSRFGTEATLRRYLPSLLSALGADAFHPMIRLGYAVRFQFAPEISAALAYFATKGPNHNLELLAQQATVGDIVWPTEVELDGRTFNEKYEDCLHRVAPAVHVPSNALRTFAFELLEILRGSQDFFALHLVTATHAFMSVDSKVQLESPKLYAAAILVGYRTAGAPQPGSSEHFNPDRFGFDHDVKLAFALSDLAQRLNSDRYQQTAEKYIQHLPSVNVGLEEVQSELAG